MLLPIQPDVHGLVLDPSKCWQFRKQARKDFENNPAGRIWWVNASTKIKTSMRDQTYAEDDLTLPSGMYVFGITDQPVTNERLVSELTTMFDLECKNPSVPYYNMAPYNNLHTVH